MDEGLSNMDEANNRVSEQYSSLGAVGQYVSADPLPTNWTNQRIASCILTSQGTSTPWLELLHSASCVCALAVSEAEAITVITTGGQ